MTGLIYLGFLPQLIFHFTMSQIKAVSVALLALFGTNTASAQTSPPSSDTSRSPSSATKQVEFVPYVPLSSDSIVGTYGPAGEGIFFAGTILTLYSNGVYGSEHFSDSSIEDSPAPTWGYFIILGDTLMTREMGLQLDNSDPCDIARLHVVAPESFGTVTRYVFRKVGQKLYIVGADSARYSKFIHGGFVGSDTLWRDSRSTQPLLSTFVVSGECETQYGRRMRVEWERPHSNAKGERVVTGRVVDEQTGVPVPRVDIYLNYYAGLTFTNFDNYSYNDYYNAVSYGDEDGRFEVAEEDIPAGHQVGLAFVKPHYRDLKVPLPAFAK